MSYIFIPVLTFLVDFATKWAVVSKLPFGHSLKVTSFFNIVHVKNFGISYGLFSTNHPLGSWFFCGIIVLVLIFLINILRKTQSRFSRYALLFVIGGALGNLFDRIYYGSVVDFLDFHLYNWHWYAFNVADCAIVIGVIVYGVIETRKGK